MAGRIKKCFVFILSIVFLLSASVQWVPASTDDPLSEVQKKLQGISSEEKEVLNNLFTMTHNIEDMAAQEEKLSQDIDKLNNEIGSLKTEIVGTEDSYNKKREVLKKVLQVYQKKGPGTYIEIILDSEDLDMFLWRISTLQDLSHNTGKLLESLGQIKKVLDDKKHGLDDKLSLAENKRNELKDSISKQVKLKGEMENYLASLNQQRGYYQEQLQNIQQLWDNLKLLFANASGEFLHIMEDENLSDGAVKINFTNEGIEGTIDQSTFNSIISKNASLSDMVFYFYEGKTEIDIPKRQLVLSGTIQVADGNVLKFKTDKGSFYGMPLEQATIDELFSKGDLSLDLKSMLGKSIINKFEIQDGSMKFTIKPVF